MVARFDEDRVSETIKFKVCWKAEMEKLVMRRKTTERERIYVSFGWGEFIN